jgi:hypothetical protein
MSVKSPGARSDLIRPTASQIDKNIVGVPRGFVLDHAALFGQSSFFDVLVKGRRVSRRHLDRENRIGGLPLRGHVVAGEALRLTVHDGVLVMDPEGRSEDQSSVGP